MKQIKSEEISSNASKKMSVRKVGTILGSGAICVMLAGAVSTASLFNDNAVKTDNRETTKAAVTTTGDDTQAEKSNAYTTLDTVIWRKASINEYEIAQVQKVLTATPKQTKKVKTIKPSMPKVTKKVSPYTAAPVKASEAPKTEKKPAETTAAKKAEAEKKVADKAKAVKKTTKAAVKKSAPKKKKAVTYTMYLNDTDVNIRAAASTSSKVLTRLSTGAKVTVLSKPNSKWYEIKYSGGHGYIASQYLSKKKPAVSKPTGSRGSSTGKKRISYTAQEFEMLCYVLQGEVGNCSEASKMAVTNVIINRVKSPSFPNTLSGVLTAGNQFTAISNYYNKSKKPTANTINCAKKALTGKDNTKGAIFYYAPKYCGGSTAAWFETLHFCMELDGQRYFKNW